MQTLQTPVARRFITLAGVFGVMSLIGHWYECLLELLQLPFGYTLSMEGVWRQLLEPYPAYGWLAVFMSALAIIIGPLFRNPNRALTKTMYFGLAAVVIILVGSFDSYVPMEIRLLPFPSVFSTLLFGGIIFGLTLKFEHRIDEILFQTLATFCGAALCVVFFLQVIFGA